MVNDLNRVRSGLGLEPNIVVMLVAILVLGMGEELWVRFVLSVSHYENNQGCILI